MQGLSGEKAKRRENQDAEDGIDHETEQQPEYGIERTDEDDFQEALEKDDEEAGDQNGQNDGDGNSGEVLRNDIRIDLWSDQPVQKPE